MKKFVPVPIIFLLFLFSTIAFAHYEHFKIPTATIAIDGNSDDWNNIEPVFEDEVNDQDPDADYDGTDLHKLYLAKDDTFLYIMLTLYDGAPYTDLPDDWSSFNFVAFQQSNSDSKVGDVWTGAEYYKNDGKWSVMVSKTESVDPLELTEIANYNSSKYINTGSNFIEWKVYLEDMGTLNQKFIRAWIHPHIAGEGDKYPTSDEYMSYVHIIDEGTTTPTPTPATGTGTIYGTVTNEEGFSFKNISVSLTGANDYSKSTKSDEEGYYEFTNLAAGDYTLTYEKNGYQTKTQEVSLEEDETLELETIYMEQTERGTISGYVTTIYGDPIESVKLKLKGIRTKAIKIESTDADGFLEFTDLETDDYMITATKRRYRSARKTVTIEEGEAKEIEIEMRKTTKRKSLSLLMRGK